MTYRHRFTKWQFDAKATRDARKATTALDHAKDRLRYTDPVDDPFTLSQPTCDAFDLINAAIKSVWTEHDAAQRRAEARS